MSEGLTVAVGDAAGDGVADGTGLPFLPALVGVAFAGAFVGVGLRVGSGVALGDVVEGGGEGDLAETLEVGPTVREASGPADEGMGLPASSTSPNSSPSSSTTYRSAPMTQTSLGSRSTTVTTTVDGRRTVTVADLTAGRRTSCCAA